MHKTKIYQIKMNRIVNPYVRTKSFHNLNKLVQLNHVRPEMKRNFGCVTTAHTGKWKLLERREECGYGGTAKRYNSTVAESASMAPAIDPGFFASVYQSLSTSTPVAYVQQGLIEIHDFTGLPWWLSIVLSTFLFRSLVTLPLTIYQQKITARLEKISLEMPAIVEELKKEAAMAMRKFKWTEQHTKTVYQRSVSILVWLAK